jgi:hypothetical protein
MSPFNCINILHCRSLGVHERDSGFDEQGARHVSLFSSLLTTMIAPSTNRAARSRGPWNRQPTRLKDGATTASNRWAKTHRDRLTI